MRVLGTFLLLPILLTIWSVQAEFTSPLLPQETSDTISDKLYELQSRDTEYLEEAKDMLRDSYRRTDLSMHTRFALRAILMEVDVVLLDGIPATLKPDLAISDATFTIGDNYEVVLTITNKSGVPVNIPATTQVETACSLPWTNDSIMRAQTTSLWLLLDDLFGADDESKHVHAFNIKKWQTIDLEMVTHSLVVADLLEGLYDYSEQEIEEYIDAVQEQGLECEVDSTELVPDKDRSNNKIVVLPQFIEESEEDDTNGYEGRDLDLDITSMGFDTDENSDLFAGDEIAYFNITLENLGEDDIDNEDKPVFLICKEWRLDGDMDVALDLWELDEFVENGGIAGWEEITLAIESISNPTLLGADGNKILYCTVNGIPGEEVAIEFGETDTSNNDYEFTFEVLESYGE